jgi:uncharacterized protein
MNRTSGIASFLIVCGLLAFFPVSVASVNDPKSNEVIGISRLTDIRVVYDDKDDVWDAGVGKGLYYVRGLLESYKSLNIDPKQLKISIVLHGETAYWLLNNEAYQRYMNDPFTFNPNSKVVEELLQHGVSVEICRVTMRAHGFQPEDLLPGVVMVHDAYTRMIDLQQHGYAYIRF